ncbi:MAG: SufD family Fe-S cluster assembly protein [Defluviitaleaceae bacterium]|nr:SufD family Fe-S cluster assembly protein [Defluviitaleaceae bacterium]
MSKTDALPLAERTNIKDWDFTNLTLKEVTHNSVDKSNLIPENAKNAIIIVDGSVVVKDLQAGISIEESKEYSNLENRLITLNKEKANSKLSIKVEKNKKMDEPIYIAYVAKERSLIHQTEITLEQGAEANIVENFKSEASLNMNILSKVNIFANANLESSVINSLNGENTIYYHRLTEVHADASLDSSNFILNDSNLVFEDFTHLVGKGSEADVKTVAISDKKQKQNITVRIENLAPHSNGNIVNYGVVKDDAHLAFNGIGKIHKGMNAGDNQQESRLLNLSKTAEAIANPFLLIDEGDITAGHAASIGQIDEEQVYYLMSRGMPKIEAEKLIVTGFLTPFANSIKSKTLREALLTSIEEKLG